MKLSKKRPVLELDELWSYVGSKKNKVWIWLALERQTRQIVGLAFGNRGEETCKELWKSLPGDYRKRGILYTDFWDSYQAVLPSKRHRPVSKDSGETSHIERFNNTLRQRCSNLVRKTLSFSKIQFYHEIRIRTFIEHYNQTRAV
ncbi:MAG: insertion element IS1 protein InsB [bacterium]|nr:MAG: insertion element IS1 protein InsB [bacterium]